MSVAVPPLTVRGPSVPVLLVHQLRYELKSYWRNPVSAFFTFAFPIMFLVLFASLNLDSHIDFLGGLDYNQYYVPSIAAFGLISACYSYLGVQISIRRDTGVFKRLRGTPLPASALIGGMVANAIVVAVILLALTLTVGTVFYGLQWHGHLLALGCAAVLGAVCFCAVGIAISTLAPNGEAAPAVVNFALFPLTFISGTFFPIQPSSFFSNIASIFPIKPFTDAMFAPFNPRTTGLGFSGHDFLVMGLWTVGATLVALRRFRWEPDKH
jgi:ABC-2 type transport system permease protein